MRYNAQGSYSCGPITVIENTYYYKLQTVQTLKFIHKLHTRQCENITEKSAIAISGYMTDYMMERREYKLCGHDFLNFHIKLCSSLLYMVDPLHRSISNNSFFSTIWNELNGLRG